MDNHDLLSDHQFGFLKGRSTGLQLMRVMDHWTEILEKGDKVDTIYLDFKKAFDTVPHERLIQKLKCYGFNEKIVQWNKDFLSDRTHQVVVQGATSSPARVKSGIPQGSVMGPLLFVIYINDLPDKIKTNVKLFADDTKIYNSIGKPKDCESLQDDLSYLEEWSNLWLLKFHPDKCSVLKVGKNTTQHDYKLEGTTLKVVDSEKDLGVTTDPELKFREHINDKVNTANKIAGIIRRLFKNLDEKIFKRLFTSMVRPHLEYCQAVWSPYLKADIEKLENVQRRASKCIASLSNLSYRERLRRLELPTLRYRRLRGDMIECYKVLNGLYDRRVSQLLTLRSDIVTTDRSMRGHKHMLYAKNSKSATRRHSFTQRVVDIWNNLPENVVDSGKLDTFKNRLDWFWRNQDFKFDFEADYNFRQVEDT
jgi:hypothetical protein